MSNVRRIRHALGATATLAVLAGCAGGGSQTSLAPLGQGAASQSTARQDGSATRVDNSLLAPNAVPVLNAPITSPSFLNSDAAAKPLLFVSDAANGVVKIYPAAGKDQKMVGQITGLAEPQGLTVDGQSNLYVANTNDSNVLVYAPPYTKAPALKIADPHNYPADVAVSASGLVAITNICNAPTCSVSTGSVSLYAKGSTKACATVSDSSYNFARVMFAAFDKNGTLYIDGLNLGYQTSVGVITGGCNATSISNLGLVYTIAFPGGIGIDKAGRIAITDPVRHLVETFDPPVNGQLGNATSTSALTGSKSPLGIAFLASGASFYVADSGGPGVSNEYAYTAGGKPENRIVVGGQPVGVAITPPLQP